MFDDPKITKIIIFALIGIIVVLSIAVIYLAVKKNTYYVDEEGEEITHFSSGKTSRRNIPPVEETPVTMPEEDEQPLEGFDDEPENGGTLEVPMTSAPADDEISSVDITVTVENETNQHRITGFPCLLGRDSGCDLVIKEPAVSRRHAQFVCEDGALYLEDVSEHNGTYLNGVKLPSLGKARVHNGDIINLGRAEITIGAIHH